MLNTPKPKQYDLEERTLLFSKSLIPLIRDLPKNTINFNFGDQLIRSGTSIGANYREANETETKKDFAFRMRICRKEGKETVYWLRLLMEANPDLRIKIEPLLQEAMELVKICAAIIEKTK